MNSQTTITFDPISSKYFINFYNTTIITTLTDKSFVVDEWFRDIQSTYANMSTPVGLDIEWRPHHIRYMSNKSATLQLCINNKCLILQLFYLDQIPQSLKDFLANPNFTSVGVEVNDDVSKLRNEYGLVCGCSADVRELAMAKWPGRFRRPGFKDLAMEVVGIHMKKPKHISMSNWEARVLICLMKVKASMLPLMLMLLGSLVAGYLIKLKRISGGVSSLIVQPSSSNQLQPFWITLVPLMWLIFLY